MPALRPAALVTALALVTATLPAQTQSAQTPAPPVPDAVTTDPPRDSAHPARMEVLHVPTGGVRVNGVAYLAAGAGPKPTLVLLHGLPGNEKNLDLAQAVRRAGWNAVTVNYRGSWGSPGAFRFAHVLEDARAVLAYVRRPETARALGIDTARLVLAGHSMGGWATVHTAAADRGLRGAVLVSAADMGAVGAWYAAQPRITRDTAMASEMESLAGVTARQMADELTGNVARWRFDRATAGLAGVPLLVLSSNDGLAPQTDSLVAAVRGAGNTRVAAEHVATDHSWSDRRIALAAAVVAWLQALPR